MQSNLEPYSLAGRTIALPLPRSTRAKPARFQTTSSLRPSRELLRARQSVIRASRVETLVWLVLGLSAVALLGLSLAF